MGDFEEQEYTKKLDIGLWGKIIGFGMKYRRHLFALIGLDMLIPLFDAIFPQLTRYAVNTFIEARDTTNIVMFVVIYLICVVCQSGNIFMFVDIAGKIETFVVHDVREKGFKKIQELSFSYFDTTAVGWIIARMTTDAQRIGDTIAWGVVDIFWALTYVVLVTVFMFATNVWLGFVTVCVIPVMVVLSIFFQRVILRGHREARKINSKITGAYAEGINGAKTTKTLVREDRSFEEFRGITSSYWRANIRVMSYTAFYYPLMFALGSVGVGLVIWQGGGLWLQERISLGDLTAFISYSTMLFDPINRLAEVISEMQSAQASGERTLSLIETDPEITDDDALIAIYGDWEHPKPENWGEPISGRIEFKDVTFKYKTGEEVLKNFNLTVKAGEKIALVGETGSGKSTIVNLVCRFYEPTVGSVLIDGVDYRERTQIWLQSNLGYVLQSPHLFSGTIKENIRYGKLDATDAEITAAAAAVNALPFIEKLEKKFDSEVGEGGNRLSSGEKQLISFARALIGNPRIFVLDEATSSIDTETEQTIQKAIYSALEGRTSFIVAHRLSTIRRCDRILVVSDGEVIESGNHKQLLKQRGHYYNLYMNQFKEEAENKLLGIEKQIDEK